MHSCIYSLSHLKHKQVSELSFTRGVFFLVGYKGCFKDKRFGRVLPDKVTKLGDGMTVETCRDICKKEKTKYYGLEVT